MSKKHEAIWKKLLLWNFVVDYEIDNQLVFTRWVRCYKECCVDIYTSLPANILSTDSLKQKIIKFNGKMKNTMDGHYHTVIHIFMALICYFSIDHEQILD